MYYNYKIGNFTSNSIDMPEISSSLSHHSQDTFVKIWKIEESADFFLNFPDSWSMPPIKAHVQANKYLESLAARYCLWQLMKNLDLQDFELQQDERQRPFLTHPEWNVSISHSYPFSAACISKKPQTGIDLEKKGRNIQKIAPRFLNAIEYDVCKEDSLKLTLAWSAKESIYKAWNKPGLSLQNEIQVIFDGEKLQGMVHQQNPFNVLYEIYQDFVLTLVNH
jgi:4'-phosphopantetheinyl transferase EntD